MNRRVFRVVDAASLKPAGELTGDFLGFASGGSILVYLPGAGLTLTDVAHPERSTDVGIPLGGSRRLLSRDNKMLAIFVPLQNRIALVNLERRAITFSIPETGRPNTLAFAPATALLADVLDDAVKFWSTDNGRLRYVLTDKERGFSRVYLPPLASSSTVLTKSRNGRSLRLWNLNDGTPRGEPVQLTYSVETAEFSADWSRLLAVSSGWLHTFSIEPAGLRPEYDVSLNGDCQALRLLDPSATLLVMDIASGSAHRLVVLHLNDPNAPVLTGTPAALLGQYRARLNLTFDEKGDAVPVGAR